MMSGLAGGAERIYLPEEGITLKDLQADVERMVESFRGGRRLYLTIRNECANEQYTTDFLARLFEEEGNRLFDVRQAVLGHIQQGGNPSPFDRILATRLAAHGIDFLTTELERGTATGVFMGLTEGKLTNFRSSRCRIWSISPTGGRWNSGGWICARSCRPWHNRNPVRMIPFFKHKDLGNSFPTRMPRLSDPIRRPSPYFRFKFHNLSGLSTAALRRQPVAGSRPASGWQQPPQYTEKVCRRCDRVAGVGPGTFQRMDHPLQHRFRRQGKRRCRSFLSKRASIAAYCSRCGLFSAWICCW